MKNIVLIVLFVLSLSQMCFADKKGETAQPKQTRTYTYE